MPLELEFSKKVPHPTVQCTYQTNEALIKFSSLPSCYISLILRLFYTRLSFLSFPCILYKQESLIHFSFFFIASSSFFLFFFL